MRVKSSNKSIKGLECIDPNRDVWVLRWDISNGSYEEKKLYHKPSLDEIKDIVIKWHNNKIKDKIINGFEWNGIHVYINEETQMNVALFSESSVTPMVLKLGTDENPIYHTFDKLGDLRDLRDSMANHIKDCLSEGWNRKKNIDWSIYQ